MSFTNNQRTANWVIGFIEPKEGYIAFLIIQNEIEQQTIVEELNEFIEFLFYSHVEASGYNEESVHYLKYQALESLLEKLLSESGLM